MADNLSCEGLISINENHKISNYIVDHKPLKGIHYYPERCNGYYWEAGIWPPRLAWLNSKIKDK
jgi:hypothetical protein